MRFFYSIALCLLISALSTAQESNPFDYAAKVAAAQTDKALSPPKHAVLVFDSACLTTVTKGENTKLEVPLNDKGEPQYKEGRAINVHITFNKECGHYEFRDAK
jgi:hypothetical protein